MTKKKKVVKLISNEELRRLHGGQDDTLSAEDTFFTVIAPAAGPAADGTTPPLID